MYGHSPHVFRSFITYIYSDFFFSFHLFSSSNNFPITHLLWKGIHQKIINFIFNISLEWIPKVTCYNKFLCSAIAQLCICFGVPTARCELNYRPCDVILGCYHFHWKSWLFLWLLWKQVGLSFLWGLCGLRFWCCCLVLLKLKIFTNLTIAATLQMVLLGQFNILNFYCMF